MLVKEAVVDTGNGDIDSAISRVQNSLLVNFSQQQVRMSLREILATSTPTSMDCRLLLRVVGAAQILICRRDSSRALIRS